MKVSNKINSNYQNTFTAGINSTLYKKMIPDNSFSVDVFEKVEDVYKINNNKFVLADAIYNAKEKVAEFILTAVDTVRFIPGLENVQPKIIKSSGENLVEAFRNIDLNDLKKANNELTVDYLKTFKETEGLRNEIYAKRAETLQKLNDKFNNFEGFWPNYYRNLEARKK